MTRETEKIKFSRKSWSATPLLSRSES